MEGKKLRCHPTIILENLGAGFIILFWIFVGNLDDLVSVVSDADSLLQVDKETLLALAVVGGIFLFILIMVVLRWYKTTITIEEGTILLERRTLNRKVSTFAIASIANINMEQNLFERIVGTYKIKIDTDSRTTANETDIKIVLGKKNANAFRSTVLELMKQNKHEQEVPEAEQAIEEDFEKDYLDDSKELEYDLMYTPKQILMHCLYTLSVFSILLIIAGIVIIAIGVHTLRTDGLAKMIEDEGTIGFLVTVFIVFFAAIRSLIGDLIGLYDFRIKRTPEKLFISYGLIKKRKYALPISRIHSVKIEQTMISRLLGKYYAEIILIGIGDENEEGSHLFLASGKEEFERYMQILLPEFAIPPDEKLMKQPGKVFVAKLWGILLHLIIISVILFIGLGTKFIEISHQALVITLVVAAYTVFIALNYILSYHADGIYAGEQFLIISEGCFGKTQHVIPYKEIQYMEIDRNPLSRAVGLSKATIFILAAALHSIVATGYFEGEIFEKIAEKMVAAVNPVNIA